tara:strand:- start:195 stop:836 length:642 start_codon:yes stop_codon:yes gene_type:complete
MSEYTQVCQKCNKKLSLNKFHKCKAHSTGYRQSCKECRKPESKSRYEVKSEHIKAKVSEYREDNPHVNKEYYSENKEYFEKYRKVNKAHYKQWRTDNREKLNEYRREKIKNDPSFKVACNLRKRLNSAVSDQTTSKKKSTMALLGCELTLFLDHIEKLFTHDMTWGNYGEWHLDHITPCASFDLTKQKAQEECFHYTNLQPLWAIDNLIKGDR